MSSPKRVTAQPRSGAGRPRAGVGTLAELHTLGDVRLFHRGEDLTAKLGPKHLALLIYLYHEQRPMHPSEVTELLGRGQDDEREVEALKRAVSWLRNNVPGVNIRLAADTIEAIGGVWVDTKDVDSAIDGSDPEHVAELYVGEFLEGFESGSRPYDEWAQRERGRLKRAWSHAMISAAGRTERQGRWDVAARWWQILVDRAPMRPEPVAGLLRAYAKSGREREAAEAYADYRERLQQSGVAQPAEPVLQVVAEYEFLRSDVEPAAGTAVARKETAKPLKPSGAGAAEPPATPEPAAPPAARETGMRSPEAAPDIPGFQPGARPVLPEEEWGSPESADDAAADSEASMASPDEEWEQIVDIAAIDELELDVGEPPAPPKAPAKAGPETPSPRPAPAPPKARPATPSPRPAPTPPKARAEAPTPGPKLEGEAAAARPRARRPRRSTEIDDHLRDASAAANEFVDKGYERIRHEVTSVRKPWRPFLEKNWEETAPLRAEAARLIGVAARRAAAGLAALPDILGRFLAAAGRVIRAASLSVWRAVAGVLRAIGRGLRALFRGVAAVFGGVFALLARLVRASGRGAWAAVRSLAIVGRLFRAGGRGVAGMTTRAAARGRRAGQAGLGGVKARRQRRAEAKASSRAAVRPRPRPPARPRRPTAVEPPPAPASPRQPAAVEPRPAPPRRRAAARPSRRGRVRARHWFRVTERAAEGDRRARRSPLSVVRRFWYAPLVVGIAALGFAFGPEVLSMVSGLGQELPAKLPEVQAPSLPRVTLPKVSVPQVAVPNVAVKTPAFVETSVSKIAELLAGPLLGESGQWVLVADFQFEEAGGEGGNNPPGQAEATPATQQASSPVEAAAVSGLTSTTRSRVEEYSAASLTVALETDFAQARYFRVVPRERALVALSRFQGVAGESLSVEAALAAAQAAGFAVVIDARLRRGESVDSIKVQVLNAAGDTLYGVAAEVSDSLNSMATLTGLSRTVRRRLGEPREAIEASLAPAHCLTSVASALNAYAQARQHLYSGRYYSAAQAAREAVQRDSTFALAYRLLAEAYALRGRRSEGRSALEAAWLLSQRATERERLRITADRLAWDGRLTDAALAYDQLFQRYRDDVGALRSQAIMQRKVGARGRGDGNLRVAYTIDPLDWPPLSRVARYLGYYGPLPNPDSLVAALAEAPEVW